MRKITFFIGLIILFSTINSWGLTEDNQASQDRLMTNENPGPYVETRESYTNFSQRVTITGKLLKLNDLYALSYYEVPKDSRASGERILVEYFLDGNRDNLEKYINKTITVNGLLRLPNGYRYLTVYYFNEVPLNDTETLQVFNGTVKSVNGEEVYYYLQNQAGQTAFLLDDPKKLSTLVGSFVQLTGKYRLGSAPNVYGGEKLFEVSSINAANPNTANNSTNVITSTGTTTPIGLISTNTISSPRVFPTAGNVSNPLPNDSTTNYIDTGYNMPNVWNTNQVTTTTSTNTTSSLKRILELLTSYFSVLVGYITKNNV